MIVHLAPARRISAAVLPSTPLDSTRLGQPVLLAIEELPLLALEQGGGPGQDVDAVQSTSTVEVEVQARVSAPEE
jgi:hypothetical protein